MRLNIPLVVALFLSVSWPFNYALAEPTAEFFWGADVSYLNVDQSIRDTSPRYVIGFKTTESSRFELSYQDDIFDLNYKKSFPDYTFDRFVPFVSVGLGGGSESDSNFGDINIYRLQTFIGADYRINSILELTSGLGFGVARIEDSFSYGDEFSVVQAYLGLRVFPF